MHHTEYTQNTGLITQSNPTYIHNIFYWHFSEISQVGQYGSRKAENSKQASSTASSDDQKGFSGLKDIAVGDNYCLELVKNS